MLAICNVPVPNKLTYFQRLESIISGAALMADSSCTRDERREKIVAECNAVRQALQVKFRPTHMYWREHVYRVNPMDENETDTTM